jgi:electron transfer flavoprotein alpha subunit
VAEASPAPAPGAIEGLAVTATRSLPSVATVDRLASPASGPSIDDASIIVGAGRGIEGPAGLALVEELASVLGGAVGATRAAVDAGWVDFAQQIGQTGKSIKPDLYIAVGVSGAIQHRVGVQNVGTVVAIDKDREAPITAFADLVVIGDLFEVLPPLTAAIKAARDSG